MIASRFVVQAPNTQTPKIPNLVRLTKAGTNASMKRCSRPGTILDGFSRSALKPPDIHCCKLVGFIGMIRGSNPSLTSTGRSIKHI